MLNIKTIGFIQAKILVPYLKSKANNPEEAFKECYNHIQSIVNANKRYSKADDIVSFLLDLRNTIIQGDKGIQLLGIGLQGSFFDAETGSFGDETAVHLSFTEKYRIVGSIFLWFVCYDLRESLSEVFGLRIHVKVSSATDLSQKLMCKYTMDYIWT
ncbi:MAG: hypothetical protein EOP34_11525, partial [Rickettsiales bacterium]